MRLLLKGIFMMLEYIGYFPVLPGNATGTNILLMGFTSVIQWGINNKGGGIIQIGDIKFILPFPW